jgi:hypothetical protein
MSCDSKANGFGILPFLLDEISLKISNWLMFTKVWSEMCKPRKDALGFRIDYQKNVKYKSKKKNFFYKNESFYLLYCKNYFFFIFVVLNKSY